MNFPYIWITAILSTQTILAQDAVISHSLYRSIRVIDDRPDTARGASTGAFQQYFDAMMDLLTDSTAARSELWMQIRSFSAYGLHGPSHRGGTWIRAVLYARTSPDVPDAAASPVIAPGNGPDKTRDFAMLAVLDTTVETTTNLFKGSLHKRVTTATDEALTAFIARNIIRRPATDRLFNLAEIHGIETVVKQALPLYSTSTLKDGVYRNYRSFALQRPDGDIPGYDPRTTYILVQGGKAFIFTESGPLPLVRKADHFYYIGRISMYSETASEFASLSSLAVATAALGGPKLLVLWNLWKKKDFWMKMDPVSGHFVAEREVKKEERP
jgi:hypothetical protein